MNILKGFFKVVPSTLFTKPNNILLKPSHNIKYLCIDPQANLKYLHSVKALLQTINTLNQLRDNKAEFTPFVSQ
jgi:hypothetical protein